MSEEDTKRRSKSRSVRFGDGRAIDAGEESEATRSVEWSYSGVWRGVRLGENLTDAPPAPLFIPLHQCPSARGPRQPLRPPVGPHWPGRMPLWAEPVLVAGPISFRKTGLLESASRPLCGFWRIDDQKLEI
jgi:hypothetical protein